MPGRARAAGVDYDPVVRRRQFVVASVGGATLVGCKALRYRPGQPEPLDQHELDTVAAMADTFLPGDDGTPGAHEANALATIIDPAYGLTEYLPELVADVDQWCLATKLAVFTALSPRDREVVLEQRMGLRGKAVRSLYRPAYEGVLALAKLAFFGGLANPLGTNFLAFPGPSRGYAPGSAAGAYASSDRPWAIARGKSSVIRVAGAGIVSGVQASAFATTEEPITAVLRVHAPDGRHHDVPLRGGGDVVIESIALPLAGGPAAGAWRLAIAAHSGGRGRLELWSLRLRTELDDRG
jgi:hypothetical protein